MNLNRITRTTRTHCPACQTLDDHTVTGWEVRQPGAGVREHCCRYCGHAWIEVITADLNHHYVAWKPSTPRA